MTRPAPPREVLSFCRICAAACGIVVTVDGARVQRVRGDRAHPISRGYTCAKGRALPIWHHSSRRLDTPVLRGETATWDGVLDDLARIVGDVTRAGGPDAFAGYLATGLAYDVNGWMAAERLLRRIGTRQRYTPVTLDNAPVLRAAELVTGSAQCNPVWEPERSTLLLLFGTNPVVSHGYGTTLADPVNRLRDFRRAGGAVWVIDPRRTETAALADRHLAVRPGTDHLVLAWLVRALLDHGADDTELARHCDPDDIARLREALEPYDVERVARTAAVGPDQLVDLAEAVRRSDGLAAMCGTGVTMSRDGVVAEWLRWALLIVVGSIDRGRGMRCNSGWLVPLDASARTRPATRPNHDALEPGPASRPELARWQGQLPCVALADEIDAGTVRVLLVAGGNPLTAFPEPDRTRAALARLDALVVLDVVSSELTDLATHVLPLSGQLERADVSMLENVAFANGNQHAPAVVAPGADRRPAWWALAQLGRRLGHDVLGGRDPDACDDDVLLADLAAGSRGGYAALVAGGPRGVRAPGRDGWVHDQVLPAGRWNLAPEALVARLRALPDPEPHLVLVPRRRVSSMTSARYGDLTAPTPEPVTICLHPDDAAAVGISGGTRATLRSAHGRVTGTVEIDATLRPGVASCTHGDRDVEVGNIVSGRVDVDPETGMPRAAGVPVTVIASTGKGAERPRRAYPAP